MLLFLQVEAVVAEVHIVLAVTVVVDCVVAAAAAAGCCSLC